MDVMSIISGVPYTEIISKMYLTFRFHVNLLNIFSQFIVSFIDT
jgi:hypothetical protein